MKKSIEYRNERLVFHIYGEGLPVVLLHGFAETSSIWKNQTKFLGNHFKLIIPDLPGSGESQLPDLPLKDLTIEELAGAVYSIIQNENVEQCIMLGHSMGGYITLAFAEKYPGKLKAFGFVQSTAFADSEEKKQTRLKGIKVIESYGGYIFLKTSTPGLFANQFKKEHSEIVNDVIEAGKDFKSIALQQYYYAMMQRPDRTHVLKSSKVPVLFVMGTEDTASPLNDGLKQVHLPEIAYIHIIENIGHMSMLEAAGELNCIIENFANACT